MASSTGLSQDFDEVELSQTSQTSSQNYEEIEGIADQQIIGEPAKSIEISQIEEWHKYVITQVKRSAQKQVNESFQKFINQQGKLIVAFLVQMFESC